MKNIYLKKKKKNEKKNNPPVTPVQSYNSNIPEDMSIGLMPIFAFILIAIGLYATWRLYAPKTLTTDYQAI